jgi:type IV pilus assembly protein PilC
VRVERGARSDRGGVQEQSTVEPGAATPAPRVQTGSPKTSQTSPKIRIERVTRKESETVAATKKEEVSGDLTSLLREQEREQQHEREETQRIVTLNVRAPRKSGGILGVLKSLNNIGMGRHRAQFIQNLSMMLGAGLPLIEALQTLQIEVRQRSMRKVITSIRTAVENGFPLWRAMEDQYLFSPYEVALVRVGEEAGNLARNMEYLAVQQEKDRSLRQKVKMAMIYPSIVLVLMFGVVAVLGMFVLPNLVSVLYSLNVELPLMTRIVIAATHFFEEQGPVVVPLVGMGMVVLGILAKFTPLRGVAQWVVFQIPGIGRLAKEATIARFGVVLGGLLEAGVPLVESLQSLEEVTHIVAYRRLYGRLVERVAIGDSFATCFHSLPRSRRLIPLPVQQLVITGERSGSLAKTFTTIAEIYDRKAEETAKKLPVILEPILLLIIGGLVGAIALSIIMPIYSAVGNVKNG